MSYQKRKLKKSKLNRLFFKFRVTYNKFFKRKEKKMRLPQTTKIMSFLRERGRLVRPNNQKIADWVDGYINKSFLSGDPIVLVSQWCISKDLEERYKKQGGSFIPTKKERKVFELEIPRIISVFTQNGIRVSWWLTFNRSYLDSGRINRGLENAYKKMIEGLAFLLIESGMLLLIDWEDEVLGQRSLPNKRILERVESFVAPSAFGLELERHSRWAREEAGLKQSDEEIRQDVCYQIACEIEEGRLLNGSNSPFGDFILIPLEAPERYDFFTVLAGDFKRRIVPVITSHPWRL